MKKTEAVTPREVLERLLRAAGDDLVLVGGQALAFWVHRYGLMLPADVVAVSADTEFLAPSAADRAAVLRMATALRGKTQFPSSRALTALVGQAYLDINDDEFINIDVVFRVIGLTQEAIRKRAVRVEVDDTSFSVMHPLDVLRSRAANLYKLVEKQNPKGVMQLALAIDVARQFLREQARVLPQRNSSRSSLQPFVSEIEHLALEDAGRKMAKRFGLHVADAIDPSLIPAGPLLGAQVAGAVAADVAAVRVPVLAAQALILAGDRCSACVARMQNLRNDRLSAAPRVPMIRANEKPGASPCRSTIDILAYQFAQPTRCTPWPTAASASRSSTGAA